MRPVAWLAVGFILATCGQRPAVNDVREASSSTPATTVIVTGTAEARIPAMLEGFPIATVHVSGEELLVAVADTDPHRVQGLMLVEDLGDLDGMLFSYEEAVETAFVMRNTLIPLDIVFFDTEGAFVAMLEMVPCTDEPCRLYSPSVAFRWALEVPAGSLAALGSSDRLELTDIS